MSPTPELVIPAELVIKIDMNRKIHEQITPETWCKREYGVGDGHSGYCSFCLYGWLDQRYPDDPGPVNRINGLRDGFIDWNDLESTTFDDVLKVLKEADL